MDIAEQNRLMDEERSAGMIPPTEQEMQISTNGNGCRTKNSNK